MIRFRLRTLLILLAVGPPMLAGAWWGILEYRRQVAEARLQEYFARAKERATKTRPRVSLEFVPVEQQAP
jgi:hypothetical protein